VDLTPLEYQEFKGFFDDWEYSGKAGIVMKTDCIFLVLDFIRVFKWVKRGLEATQLYKCWCT